MNPAALPVLESVDTEWDRISAGKGLLNTSCQHGRGPDLHCGGCPRVQTGYLSALCWRVGFGGHPALN